MDPLGENLAPFGQAAATLSVSQSSLEALPLKFHAMAHAGLPSFSTLGMVVGVVCAPAIVQFVLLVVGVAVPVCASC